MVGVTTAIYSPSGGNVATHRDPVLAEMRLKIHQRLIGSARHVD